MPAQLKLNTGASQTKLIVDRAYDPTDAANFGQPEPAKFLNGLSVTATVKDSDGDAIAGASDVSLSYITSSDGRYIGTLLSAVGDLLTVGGDYTVTLVFKSGDTTLLTMDVQAVGRRPQSL